MKKPSVLVAILIVIGFGGCTILKPEDAEVKVRAFLSTFEQTLDGTDQDILHLFETQQTQEAILAAVRVLQEQTEYEIGCSIYYDQATISFEDAGIRVVIPTNISGSVGELISSVDTNITFILSPSKDSFVITTLEGEEFYNSYVSVKSELAQSTSDDAVHEEMLYHIEVVKSLQEKYDTVIWVADYEGKSYYYVANGSWSVTLEGSFRMGIADENGQEIIPVNYTLVGTLGFDWPDLVEIQSENGVGLFSLIDGEVVKPVFQSIIPYDVGGALALVQTDTAYSWLDKSFKIHMGLPDGAQAFLNNHEYLPAGREFSNNTMTMCEIPSEENYGSGFLIFPTYLSSTGLFEVIEADFTMNTTEWRANTESIAADHKFFDSIVDGVGMLLTSITKRYLDGREAFYTENEVTFVSNNGSWSSGATSLPSAEITLNRVDSTLIELVSMKSIEGYEFYDESSDETELDIPTYMYFRIAEDGPEEQISSREFNFTEFVKIDSSYLTGSFTYIDRETFSTSSRDFLCDSTLIKMRNEILAEYGFIFPDEQTTEHFKFNAWYQPRFESVDEFEEALSDIDRHNLKFLERIIGPVPRKESI